MTKLIRLVVSDLDGTLLDPDCRISAGALPAVRLLRERGIAFTIATGRGFFLTRPLAARLDLQTPAILSGGALIARFPAGEVIDAQPLALRDAAALLEYGRAAGLGVSFHEVDGVLAEAPDPVWERSTARNWLPEEPQRVAAYTRSSDLLEGRMHPPLRVDLFGPAEIIEAAASALPGRFPHLQILKVVGHLEITRAGVNKGSAVRRLAQTLDLPLSSVAVLGDDINDLSMFAEAGVSIAMGNAHPTLKAFASTVVPPNSEGGFAWAVEHYLLYGR